jgi:hypothetical protein
MNAETTAAPEGSLAPPSGSSRAAFREAARYWEPRRIIYNALLVAVVFAWVWGTWPHFRGALAWATLPPMAFLALMANVCYSTAYLVDIPLLQSSASNVWRRRRWILWLVGTAIAFVLANYWIADEIFPDFR